MSSQKGPQTPWKWTAQREEAALLVALDTESDEMIATRVGLTRSGLKRWKARAEFAARVATIREEMRQALLARGIADRATRVQKLQDLLDRMETIVQGRAEDLRLVKGGASGLLVKQYKQVGKDDYREEYPFDAGLVREMRATLQQAAQELGQWTTKSELKVSDLDAAIERELARLAGGAEGAAAGAAAGTDGDPTD